MGLFTPAWKSKDWKKRYKAIESGKLDDEILLEIATSDSDLGVRMNACFYILSQAKLTDAVTLLPEYHGFTTDGYNQHKQCLDTIVRKVTRPDLLARIVLAGCSASFIALDQINDDKTLHTLAEKMRGTQVERIARLKLAQNGHDEQGWIEYGNAFGFDEEIVSHIKDAATLMKIIKTSESNHVKYAAIRRIKDDEVLFRLLTTLSDAYVRHEIVSHIKDIDTLRSIFSLDKSALVKMKAAKKLIRFMAKNGIPDEAECLQIAKWMIEHNTAEIANPSAGYIDGSVFGYIAEHLPQELLAVCGISLKEYYYEEAGDFGNILTYEGYEVCYRGESVSRIDKLSEKPS